MNLRSFWSDFLLHNSDALRSLKRARFSFVEIVQKDGQLLQGFTFQSQGETLAHLFFAGVLTEFK
jgi:hypothetical protein